ncbi:MAG: DUF3256 family protein [Tannerellaceae bacterium]|nr:DUF3256 family protein [Tannerellaceae bacterium]
MRHVIFTICFSFLAICGMAQTINSSFISIPDSLLPHLEKEWRQDLIDLYTAGKTARLQNMIGGYSVLEQLSDDYLLLKTTERSSVEMKLLPLVNKTHLICLVRTVAGPVEDSQVLFYTTDWEPLDATDLLTPVTKEWFVREDLVMDQDTQFLLNMLDMDLVRYNLDAETQTLTATYKTPDYLGTADREKVLPLLKKEPKVYTWNNSYFR